MIKLKLQYLVWARGFAESKKEKGLLFLTFDVRVIHNLLSA